MNNTCQDILSPPSDLLRMCCLSIIHFSGKFFRNWQFFVAVVWFYWRKSDYKKEKKKYCLPIMYLISFWLKNVLRWSAGLLLILAILFCQMSHLEMIYCNWFIFVLFLSRYGESYIFFHFCWNIFAEVFIDNILKLFHRNFLDSKLCVKMFKVSA